MRHVFMHNREMVTLRHHLPGKLRRKNVWVYIGATRCSHCPIVAFGLKRAKADVVVQWMVLVNASSENAFCSILVDVVSGSE